MWEVMFEFNISIRILYIPNSRNKMKLWVKYIYKKVNSVADRKHENSYTQEVTTQNMMEQSQYSCHNISDACVAILLESTITKTARP